LTAAILQKLSSDLPGQEYIASQPIQMRFNELLEGSRADVALKIFGADMPKLVELAHQAQKLLEPIEGAGDVEADITGTSPLLKIEPITARFAAFGANVYDVLETVQIGIGGMEAGWFYEGTRRHPIVVRAADRYRNNPQELRKLPVGLGAHSTVPLESLAELHQTETYGSIARENSQRKTTVMMNIRGRDTQSLVNEAREKVQALQLPEDYFLEWGGNFKNLQSAKKRLMILTPLALLLVLGMIFAAFGNVVQTMIVFSGVPLALAGGVLGLIVNHLPFSISAGIGFIALCGVAVLNGVVLMNYFNYLHTQGKRGVELVLEGCQTRLRPVLMTALVAAFGFVPMMFSQGVGAEVQRPLASVVIGGIISSTLLTLIVLPVLYLYFERSMHHYKAPSAH
jgi:cobalt-zinc-cadmium resistance protein CzcA